MFYWQDESWSILVFQDEIQDSQQRQHLTFKIRISVIHSTTINNKHVSCVYHWMLFIFSSSYIFKHVDAMGKSGYLHALWSLIFSATSSHFSDDSFSQRGIVLSLMAAMLGFITLCSGKTLLLKPNKWTGIFALNKIGFDRNQTLDWSVICRLS